MKPGIWKITRVLEYTGPWDWIERVIQMRGVKETRSFERPVCEIKEASISEPELVRDSTQEELVRNVNDLLSRMTCDSLTKVEAAWFEKEPE